MALQCGIPYRKLKDRFAAVALDHPSGPERDVLVPGTGIQKRGFQGVGERQGVTADRRREQGVDSPSPTRQS